MRVRKEEVVGPIHLEPGDSIQAVYTDEEGVEHVLARDTIDRLISINKAVIFDVEAGEFGDDVTDGIGGAFLQTSSLSNETNAT